MRYAIGFFSLLCATASFTAAQVPRSVGIEELNIEPMEQEWGTPQKNRSVLEKPMKIAGRAYERGLGTHASSRLVLDFDLWG